jgi:hypothetical protein
MTPALAGLCHDLGNNDLPANRRTQWLTATTAGISDRTCHDLTVLIV